MQQPGSASLIWAETPLELLLSEEESGTLGTSKPGEQKGAQSVQQVTVTLTLCWGRADLWHCHQHCLKTTPEPGGKTLREKPYCGTNGGRKNFIEDKTPNQPPTKTKTNEKIKILCKLKVPLLEKPQFLDQRTPQSTLHRGGTSTTFPWMTNYHPQLAHRESAASAPAQPQLLQSIPQWENWIIQSVSQKHCLNSFV